MRARARDRIVLQAVSIALAWSAAACRTRREADETRPFLGVEEIDRLECLNGLVWVVLRDRAAADFEARTSHLRANAGRIAVYLDGKLQTAPLVRARISGGRFAISKLACKAGGET